MLLRKVKVHGARCYPTLFLLSAYTQAAINDSVPSSDTESVDVTNQNPSIESLKDRIAALVGERQRLRAEAATRELLEANREEIARLQHELSQALIALYLPPPQPGLA